MDFDIQDYLAKGVEIIMKDAMRATLKNPKESLFLDSWLVWQRNKT